MQRAKSPVTKNHIVGYSRPWNSDWLIQYINIHPARTHSCRKARVSLLISDCFFVDSWHLWANSNNVGLCCRRTLPSPPHPPPSPTLCAATSYKFPRTMVSQKNGNLMWQSLAWFTATTAGTRPQEMSGFINDIITPLCPSYWPVAVLTLV